MPSYAKHGYIIPLLLALMIIFITKHIQYDEVMYSWGHLVVCCFLAAAVTAIYFMRWPRSVYLVDFSCYKPEESCEYTSEAFVERSMVLGTFTDANVQFQKKILERSGIGQSTYFPPAVATIPPDLRISEARKEGEMVMFGAVDQLLAKTGIETKAIDILIVNCSLFSPTPSLAEMILNRYKLREDVICHNLSGMGCSAGLISVELAKQLLKVSHAKILFYFI